MLKRLLLLFAILAWTLATGHAQSFTDADGSSDATVVPAREFRRLHDEAILAMSRKDYLVAETQFSQALAQDVPRAIKRDALLEMGQLLEERLNKPVKAAAIYEQFLSLFPQDVEVPQLNLRLGKLYRDLGSYKTALNKFYDVLYAALRVKDGEQYKGSAMRAQLEIANTYFIAGEYEQAGRFYSRLKLIELPTNDRRDVYFRSAYILFLSRDYAGALTAEQQFLKNFPEGALAPESQYLVVQCLKELNRQEEAMQETLKLLRSGARHSQENPEVWAYWQQKTGNDLANELYQKGDNLRALTVYQTLAEISNSPDWRWPAVYQIALCFERLRYPERALQAYKYIIDSPAAKAPDTAATDKDSIGVNLTTLREMAQWRYDHLTWMQKTESELTPLLGRKRTPAPPQLALNARSTPRPDTPKSSAVPQESPAPEKPPGL